MKCWKGSATSIVCPVRRVADRASLNGTIKNPHDGRHAVRRGHANRQPRGPHVSRRPDPSGGAARGRRGHQTQRPPASPPGQCRVAAQPARAQRGRPGRGRAAAVGRRASRSPWCPTPARRRFPTPAPGWWLPSSPPGIGSNRCLVRVRYSPPSRRPAWTPRGLRSLDSRLLGEKPEQAGSSRLIDAGGLRSGRRFRGSASSR